MSHGAWRGQRPPGGTHAGEVAFRGQSPGAKGARQSRAAAHPGPGKSDTQVPDRGGDSSPGDRAGKGEDNGRRGLAETSREGGG